MAAASTEHVTIGPFVANVMNRHPALLARMASTLQIACKGRLVLGIGIGGAPAEHEAYGMEFPEARERVARLTEAVAVLRALWTGGPVTRSSRSTRSARRHAHPVPVPPPPIIIGGETAAGARLRGTDRGRLDRLRRQYSRPICPRTSSHSRRAAGTCRSAGPRRFPRGLAERRADRRQPLGQRPTRDLGALARGRSRWSYRPRPHDRRHRRARGCGRTLVAPRTSPPVAGCFELPERSAARMLRSGRSDGRGGRMSDTLSEYAQTGPRVAAQAGEDRLARPGSPSSLQLDGRNALPT